MCYKNHENFRPLKLVANFKIKLTVKLKVPLEHIIMYQLTSTPFTVKEFH